MLRNFMTNGSKYANGMNSASVEMKRGSFVTIDEATKKLSLATGIAGAYIVDRGVKITKDVAMGLPISPYDADQDTILVGENGYLNELEGRWGTTEYDSASITASTTVGSYLDIAAGKLTTLASGTSIIKFLGLVNDNGHTLCKFEIVPTTKLA